MNQLSVSNFVNRRFTAIASHMVIALILASCTSTSSGLNSTGTGLLAGINAAPQDNQQKITQPVLQQTVVGSLNSNLALNAPSSIIQPTPSVASTDEFDQNSKLVTAAANAAANNPVNLVANSAITPLPGSVTLQQPTPSQVPISAPSTLTAPTPNSAVLLASSPIAQTGQTTPPVAGTAVVAQAPNTTIATSAPIDQQILTAAPPAPPAPVKKKSLFESLFSPKKNVVATPVQPIVAPEPVQLALVQPSSTKASAAVEPVLQPPAKLDVSKLSEPTEIRNEEPQSDNGELPGVRKGALFEIKRRDSLQDDTDVDIGETDSGPVLLASAGGFARLAPNGLRVQRESVDVACVKPQLVKLLKNIERHYNSTVVVTSGYRSPGYNRRVRGAKNSLHMFCAAVDIQVVGVSKWQLAKYARSMPGRGGVGTYCHTDSVHIDVGPDRDWNWRCARRK